MLEEMLEYKLVFLSLLAFATAKDKIPLHNKKMLPLSKTLEMSFKIICLHLKPENDFLFSCSSTVSLFCFVSFFLLSTPNLLINNLIILL